MFNSEKLFSSFVFCRSSVNFSKKKDTFLVLSQDRKHILELKDVSFSIWQNLEKPISFSALIKKLQKEYDVAEEVLEKDLKSWLKEALKEKIIKKVKLNNLNH
jgi:uracil DNA glycosylase